MQTFIKNRNHERNLIISEMAVPSAPTIMPRGILDTTITLRETKKSSASFRISKQRLINNDTVRIGRFPPKRDVIRGRDSDSDDGDLLDPDNLDRVLNKRDMRHTRYRLDSDFDIQN